MAIIAKQSTSGSFERELIPAGNYPARCYSIIEYGTIEVDYIKEKKVQHRIEIGFELPTEKKEFKEGEGAKPFVISKEFTLSLHEKAGLRTFLQTWRGKAFTEEELEGFDITKLLGCSCLLNIITTESKGNKYNQITAATTLPKGLTVPPAINNTRVLQFDGFNWDLFHSLPDYIKKKIGNSEEYKLLNQDFQTCDNQEVPF